MMTRLARSLLVSVAFALALALLAFDSPASAQAPVLAYNQSSGTAKVPLVCDAYKFDRSSTADVELVSLTASQTVYVCGYAITGESLTTSDVSLEYGTGTACASGTTGLTPPISIGTSPSGAMLAGVVVAPGVWAGLKGLVSNALCVHRSAAQTSEIQVWYSKY